MGGMGMQILPWGSVCRTQADAPIAVEVLFWAFVRYCSALHCSQEDQVGVMLAINGIGDTFAIFFCLSWGRPFWPILVNSLITGDVADVKWCSTCVDVFRCLEKLF